MHLLLDQLEASSEQRRTIGRDESETDKRGLGGTREDEGKESIDASPSNGLLFYRR